MICNKLFKKIFYRNRKIYRLEKKLKKDLKKLIGDIMMRTIIGLTLIGIIKVVQIQQQQLI
jgi:hypothetical protein